jgi:hypothetical protein
MAVFSVAPDGPDKIYRFRMGGSGHEIRTKLDRAGITVRHLIPHQKGYDVVVPDPQGKMFPTVQDFAANQKVNFEASPGHFEVIGGKDQADSRTKFRSIVSGGGG